ncbi:hypothetical protein SDC9_83197 [bioreactor metagenome]|uniref:Uncharacterized protein n=1 Tax=bioreactor metagenome TaxID=1076179 RepID=A0A644Z8I3_9ZZZZ
MNAGFAGVRPTFSAFSSDGVVLIGAGSIKLPISSGEQALPGADARTQKKPVETKKSPPETGKALIKKITLLLLCF